VKPGRDEFVGQTIAFSLFILFSLAITSFGSRRAFAISTASRPRSSFRGIGASRDQQAERFEPL
jgi:hypothetical protein